MYFAVLAFLICSPPAMGAEPAPQAIKVQWDAPIAVSRLSGSLQTGPGFGFGDWKRAEDKPHYAEGLAALRDLKADLVRYQGWHNRPDLTVAEPEPPSNAATSWDFARIDQPLKEFLAAIDGRPFVMNFSTAPGWMYKPTAPGHPSGALAVGVDAMADYFGRFAGWYTQGGFVDETGRRRTSEHRIAFPYWEVLNEPDLETAVSPQQYVERYDAIVAAVRKVSPRTRFIGLALSSTLSDPAFTTHFLNPKNHRPGIPLDYVSYHFYAHYRAAQSRAEQAAAVFEQSDHFLDTLLYIAAIRDELSPRTGIMVTEIGTMNQSARGPRPESLAYEAQLSAAMYAYLYARMSLMGVDAAHASGMVAVQPDQMWQELAMLEWGTGRPNARYWALKLLIDELPSGTTAVVTRNVAPPPYPLLPAILEMMSRRAPVHAQGFATAGGARKLLLVNRSDAGVDLTVPGASGGRLVTVDLATATSPPAWSAVAGDEIRLGPLAVAVLALP